MIIVLVCFFVIAIAVCVAIVVVIVKRKYKRVPNNMEMEKLTINAFSEVDLSDEKTETEEENQN